MTKVIINYHDGSNTKFDTEDKEYEIVNLRVRKFSGKVVMNGDLINEIKEYANKDLKKPDVIYHTYDGTLSSVEIRQTRDMIYLKAIIDNVIQIKKNEHGKAELNRVPVITVFPFYKADLAEFSIYLYHNTNGPEKITSYDMVPIRQSSVRIKV